MHSSDKYKNEKSCGAIVYKMEKGDLKYLLVHQNNGVWSFPKGHMENNENEIETALREVKEETNIDIQIIDGFRNSISYIIEDKKVNKEVVYFVAIPKNDKLFMQESEIDEVKWLDYETALNMITYDSAKKVLINAYKFIENNSDILKN